MFPWKFPVGLDARREAVRVSESVLPGGPGYETGALIPAPEWRPVRDEELEALSGNGVCVRFTPDAWSLAVALERLGVRPVGSHVNHMTAAAGSATVAVNERGEKIGLHVDRWTSRPFPRGFEAPWRVTVNLGPGSRRFLMVPVGLDEMIRRLGLESTAAYPEATELARDFLKAHPGQPVLSIEMPPGTAYLAPTDYLCHDGSTDGASEPSEVASCLVHPPVPAGETAAAPRDRRRPDRETASRLLQRWTSGAREGAVAAARTPDGRSSAEQRQDAHAALMGYHPTPVLQATLPPTLVQALVRLTDDVLENERTAWDYSSHLAGQIERGAQVRIPPEGHPIAMEGERATLFRLLTWLSTTYLRCVLGVSATPAPAEQDDAWIVSQREGDFNPRHAHDGLLSGVLYLKVPRQIDEAAGPAGCLSFWSTDPAEPVPNARSSRAERSAMTCGPPVLRRRSEQDERHRVLPVVGQAYVFPAWLMHSVSPFEGPGERRSLAFNARWTKDAPAGHLEGRRATGGASLLCGWDPSTGDIVEGDTTRAGAAGHDRGRPRGTALEPMSLQVLTLFAHERG
jgi:hypothetical protein